MSFDIRSQRKSPDAFTLPWKRKYKEPPSYLRIEEFDLLKDQLWNPKPQRFDLYPQNENIDICSKISTLKASPFVVSVERYSGHVPIFQYSGCIIESNSEYSIILTTAGLLKGSVNDAKLLVHLSNGLTLEGEIEAYDFYFGIAAIRIRPNILLPVASLAHVNDLITVDPSHLHIREEKSTSFDLIPGEIVIALGRFPGKPFSIMPALGLLSIDRCDNNCKEFFTASCRITSCGIGGPLISPLGEVIGICLLEDDSTGFLPMNIASLWWEHYKKSGQTRTLCLGMRVTNLYAAPLDTLEVIIQKFPNILEGVIVEEVVRGSSTESAGIKQDDVIIQFCGKTIKSFLELFESAWDKVGEPVEFVVVRASEDAPLHLKAVLEEVKRETGPKRASIALKRDDARKGCTMMSEICMADKVECEQQVYPYYH